MIASALLLGIGFTITAGAWAQKTTRLSKIAILSPDGSAPAPCNAGRRGSIVGCFLDGLRALGYVEGRNISVESRFTDGDYEQLPARAAELVILRPDVIYTFTAAGAAAAAKATTTIPIVVAPAGEATLSKLAGNFALPIGNVTGITLPSAAWDEKCIQLLKEIAPRISRVAVLLDPDNPAWLGYPDVLGQAAAKLAVTLIRIDARGVADLPQAFAAITASKADSIFMVDDAALAGSYDVRNRVIDWATSRGLPIASSRSVVATDGGLLAMGTDIESAGTRAASYVDRILKGAKPADLAVEQPSRFKLSVNVKTAKAIGLIVPQSLLLRADEVIQ
jgi:putative ABC transport system substrate-binding protein